MTSLPTDAFRECCGRRKALPHKGGCRVTHLYLRREALRQVLSEIEHELREAGEKL